MMIDRTVRPELGAMVRPSMAETCGTTPMSTIIAPM